MARLGLLLLVFGLVANGGPRLDIHPHPANGHAVGALVTEPPHAAGDDSQHAMHVHTAPAFAATLPQLPGDCIAAVAAGGWRPAPSPGTPPSPTGPPPHRPPIA